MTDFRNQTSSKGLIGAIIAAIVASACCVGPLIILGLGLGGAWVGNLTALEPYRPFFIVITLFFLGYAFSRIYRKPAEENCEPGSYCANPKSNTINKILLWIVTFLVLGLLAFPYVTPYIYANNGNTGYQQGFFKSVTETAGSEVCESCVPNPEKNSSLIRSDFRKIILHVPDMNCPACPVTIQKSLMQLKGVQKAEADLNTKQVIVVYDPGKVQISSLIKATENAGYPSTVVKQDLPSDK